MSNAPLFQNTDDQEAAYAPEELAAGDGGGLRGDVEDDTATTAAHNGAVALPAAAAGATYGTASTANPGLGGVAIDAGREVEQSGDRGASGIDRSR